MTAQRLDRSDNVAVGAMIPRTVAPSNLADLARRVAPGFDELWIVEDLAFSGGISQVAAVLDATSGIGGGVGPVVGHGIAPAPFRNPAALAMEWATIAELHPGRLAGGIGHGVGSWMTQIGESVASPLTLLAETIEAVQALLAGERVSMSGRYVALDDVELVFPPKQPPLVSAGVLGPKSLELSGRVAGGTILPEGQGPSEIAAARARIVQGMGGRADRAPHRLTVFAGFHCGDRSGLGPPNPDAPQGWEAIADQPAEVASKLDTLVDAGADAIVLVPFGIDVVGQLQLASTEIAPLLRA
jgi:alkanesulfonate monooxygenase SsuD/methylene tetrahydromethanopterin reductase-like flavin-dependent oxidoreductase (luciferase family)